MRHPRNPYRKWNNDHLKKLMDPIEYFIVAAECANKFNRMRMIGDWGILVKDLSEVFNGQISKNDWSDQLEKLNVKFRQFVNTELNVFDYKIWEASFLNAEMEKIRKELYDMEPIVVKFIKTSAYTDSSLQSLFEEIRDSVQKGNRVTFKSIQELINEFQNIKDMTSTSGKSNSAEEIAENHRKEIKKTIDMLFEIFDLLELVYDSIKKKDDSAWLNEMEQIMKRALRSLGEFGIEEINVNGQLFDGDKMVGLGTISIEDAGPHFEKYQVYSVYQRGFQYKNNGKMLRRAKVITVL